jgi:PKD repeat protein
MIMRSYLLILLLVIVLILPCSAYNSSYNVSPIAMGLITDTAKDTLRGVNITNMRRDIPQQTLSVALTGTTLAIGATKVATVTGFQNTSNVSTLSRGMITFPCSLPQNASVTNASIILYQSSQTVTFGIPGLYITDAVMQDNTNQVTTDYIRYYNATVPPALQIFNATPINFNTWTAATRKEIVLNQAGLQYIRNHTRYWNEGNVTFGLMIEWDITNTNRSMVWTSLTAQSAVYTIGGMQAVVHAQDPMLNITYSLPDTVAATTLPQIADFSANLTSAMKPAVIQFYDQTNNTVPATIYKWNFTGIGNNETVDSWEKNPSFTYQYNGTYYINHTVSNGDVNTSRKILRILGDYDGSPRAYFNITLTDTSTNYPTTYRWNATNLLGNNTEFTFSTAKNPTIDYLGTGNWIINLNVTNLLGFNSTTKNVGINLSSPVVYFWKRVS